MKDNKRKRSVLQSRIAQIREQRGMTQSDLAEKLGVDKTAVSHWENGVSNPSSDRIPMIASALDVPVSDLFSEAA